MKPMKHAAHMVPLKRLLMVVLSLFLSVSPVFGQHTGNLRGQVLDAESGQYLQSVHIAIVEPETESDRGTTTDEYGLFQLNNLKSGPYLIAISRIGYQHLQRSVVIATGEQRQIRIELYPAILTIPEIVVERSSIIGGAQGIKGLPGSAHRITIRSLEKYQHSDVGRALASVPGINIREEDGFGLRPNIGIRGTGSERSSKISLMEDGILTAPAPYAAPSAYYFPTIGRMQEVEIRKGSSQIKYGPYTTGGAINFLSTDIPKTAGGRFKISGGSNQFRLLHASAGATFSRTAFLLEVYDQQNDGFKDLDYGGLTGFDKSDLLAKFRVNSSRGAKYPQALLLKILRTSEKSNETYLGLTQDDFDRTPLRRYVSSKRDQMNADYSQIVLRHVIQLTPSTSLTTSVYRSTFSRNWYKLDKVSDGVNVVGISNILDAPLTNQTAYEIVTGQSSEDGGRLLIKANNRDYLSRGFQTELNTEFRTAGLSHRTEIGVRLHEDEMDRFQWVDEYQLLEDELTMTFGGAPGTDSNGIESAGALSLFVQDRVTIGPLTAQPGLRFESITLRRRDYGRTDPKRTGTDLVERKNNIRVWIPGLAVSYAWTPATTFFIGVHRGFAPPGSKEGTLPEKSRNTEVGVRTKSRVLEGELVLFHNAFQNLLGSDLASAGGSGSGDRFNGGTALVRGMEMSARYNLGGTINWRYSLPISFSYTFTNAVFKSTFVSDYGPWGTVKAGDHLPYVAAHVASIEIGVEGERFDVHLSGSFVDAIRTEAGSGQLQSHLSMDRHLVVDLGAGFQLNSKVRLFSSIRNVTDAIYVVARRPAGLRPGLPRTFLVGMRFSH